MYFPAIPLPSAYASSYSPAVALHQGKLHMVFADRSNDLYHAVFTPSPTGGSWQVTPMTGQSTSATPALVDYGGVLNCAYRATNSSRQIFFTAFDDSTSTWTYKNSAMATEYGPTLAVHEGLLRVAYVPLGGGAVMYSGRTGAALGGSSWSTPQAVNAITMPVGIATPTFASYRGQLHLLVLDASKTLLHYVYSSSIVPSQDFIPLGATGLTSPSGVAALEWNGLLQVLLQSSQGSTIVSSTFDGARWTNPVSIDPTVVVSGGPGAAALGTTLQIVAPRASSSMTQVTGLAGGSAPLIRVPIATLGGNATVTSDVPYTIFGGSRSYTVEAWVNVTSIAGTQYIVSSFDDSSQEGLMAIAIRDGRFGVWRRGNWLPSQTAPVVGEWFHVTGMYDGTYLSIFVNGNFEGTIIDNQPTLPSSTGAVIIGGDTGASARLHGKVRWVAIWNEARTTEQISADLYAQPGPQPGLMALYDFCGATPVDVSGRGQGATVNGSLQPIAETQGLLVTSSSGINCGVGNTLSFAGNQPMSAEAWVRPTSIPSSNTYLLHREGEYSLGLSSSGWSGGVAGHSPLSSGHAPVANQWTHVAITWAPSGSSGIATLYVNGLVVKTQSLSTSANATSNHTQIGSGMTGCITSVRLWNKALAANEVQTVMTQSPVGMEHLAANYDFSTTPILDATLDNDPPTITNGAALGYVIESISSDTAAQLVGIDTSVGIPYFPDEPGELYSFDSPPLLGPSSAVPRTVDEVLTPAYRASLLDTFHRSLPSDVSNEIRAHLASRHTAELERLFLLARTDPRHGLGGHRFEWVHRGERVVLHHHRPDGRSVEVTTAAADAFTPQQLWWIQFTLTLVFGFASILGIATPGSLAANLTKYITKNPAILTILATSIDLSIGITPEVVYNSLNSLWNNKFLMGMLKIIATSLGWWALGKLAIRLAGLFIPGVQELIVATMLINFTIMAVQLSLLAVDYPR